MSSDDPTVLSSLGLEYITKFAPTIMAAASTLGVSATAVGAAIAEEASDVGRSTIKSYIHDASQWAVSLATNQQLFTLYGQDSSSGSIGSPKADLSYAQRVALILSDPLHADIGIGDLQLGVALQDLNSYIDNPLFSSQGDPLQLIKYSTNYSLFASDLMSGQSDLTVKIEALNILDDQRFLISRYGSQFDSASDSVQAALLTTVNKIGIHSIPPAPAGSPLPDPELGTGGTFTTAFYNTIYSAIYPSNPVAPATLPTIPVSFDPAEMPLNEAGGFSVQNASTTFWVGGLQTDVSPLQTNGDFVAVGSLGSNTLTTGSGNSTLYAAGSGVNTFTETTTIANAKIFLVGQSTGETADQTVAQSASLEQPGLPTDVFNEGAASGTVISIGGLGTNTFDLSVNSNTATHLFWGGGGTSTYYINGSPTVYVYYMSDPTVAKIAALTPDMIKSEYSSINPSVDAAYPGATSDYDEQPINPSSGAVYIINPGQNDKIYNNGVLLSDFTSRVALDGDFGGGQSVFTSRTDNLYYNGSLYFSNADSISSNYVWFRNPAATGTPGPDTVQPFPDTWTNGSLKPGLTIANFVNGDFGITYSGPVATTEGIGQHFHAPWIPDTAFMNWSTHYQLDVQTSDENGNQLNSDNGSIMAGSGAVDYGIAADTPTALISSQGGDQGAVVE